MEKIEFLGHIKGSGFRNLVSLDKKLTLSVDCVEGIAIKKALLEYLFSLPADQIVKITVEREQAGQ